MLDSREHGGGAAVLEKPANPPDQDISAPAIEMRTVSLDAIGKGVNPRSRFDPDKLNDLTNSIRFMGVIEPIVLREPGNEPGANAPDAPRYTIIAGERRFRAATAAGLTEIPAIIRRCTEIEAVEMALEENLERDQLNAIEEAQGFAMLMMQGRTQEQIGHRLRKSQPYISNRLRLLQLPDDVQSVIADGTLSASHGISLASISHEPDKVREFMRRALTETLSVKALDDVIQGYKFAAEKAAQPAMEMQPPPTSAADIQAAADFGNIEPDGEIVPLAGPEPTPTPDAEAQDDPFAAVADALESNLDEQEARAQAEAIEPQRPPVQTEPETTPKTQTISPPPAAPEPPAAAPVVVDKRSSAADSAPRSKPAAEPAAPAPAPFDPKAGLPPGVMRALVKEEDYKALQERGLWPLAKIIEALDAKSETPTEGGRVPDPPLPAGMFRAVVKMDDYKALQERGLWPIHKAIEALDAKAEAPAEGSGLVVHPQVLEMAERLVEINTNEGTVFSSAETDILDTLFPRRERTTAEHIITVLLKRRLRALEEMDAAEGTESERE